MLKYTRARPCAALPDGKRTYLTSTKWSIFHQAGQCMALHAIDARGLRFEQKNAPGKDSEAQSTSFSVHGGNMSFDRSWRQEDKNWTLASPGRDSAALS